MNANSLDCGLDEIIKRKAIVFSDKGLNGGGWARNGGVPGRRIIRNQPPNAGKGFNVNRNNRGEACKIIINNLAETVNSSDLKQLFEESGRIKVASTPILHYDAGGSLLGTAEISLRSRADSDYIIKEFNGTFIDGKQLRMSISTPAQGTSIKDRVRGLPFSRLNQRRPHGNKKWNKAKKKTQVDNSLISADFLDLQIDGYMREGKEKKRNIKTQEEYEMVARGKYADEEEENEKKVVDADMDEFME